MKKVIFAKSSDIRGRKSSGREDLGGYKNWRTLESNFASDEIN